LPLYFLRVLAGGGGAAPHVAVLLVVLRSAMVHNSMLLNCRDAFPRGGLVPLLRFARTLLSVALCSSARVLPDTSDLPTPEKVVPPQQKEYSPVVVFQSTTLLGSESSWSRASKTVTVKEQVAVLPAASVAVQVTVVDPNGNVDPDGGTHAVVTPGQLSVATGGSKVTTTIPPGSATATTFAGQVIVGG
jgi:hypothetical protein